MKKKLIIILGSGSSRPLGMPSVADLDREMRAWSAEWAARHHCQDFFETVWLFAERYYNRLVYSNAPSVNYEKVLGELLALSYWMTPSPSGNPLRLIACDGAAPPHFVFPFPDQHGPAVGLRMQLDELLVRLARWMRRRSLDIDVSTQVFQKYAALFGALGSAFDLGVFNLNYDTAAVGALPHAWTGFDSQGRFQPNTVFDEQRWNFVYHLHGSVHFSLVAPNKGDICWKQDLTSVFFDSDGAVGPEPRSDEMLFPKTTLLAGGFKLDQLLVEPFHSFHAALVSRLYQADAVLIGGYGFGDAHVNHALRNRLMNSASRPPVVVLDRHVRGAWSMAKDLWAKNACRTLFADGWDFVDRCPNEVTSASEDGHAVPFEVNDIHGVAQWNGGFAEAADQLEKILPWLLGVGTGEQTM